MPLRQAARQPGVTQACVAPVLAAPTRPVLSGHGAVFPPSSFGLNRFLSAQPPTLSRRISVQRHAIFCQLGVGFLQFGALHHPRPSSAVKPGRAAAAAAAAKFPPALVATLKARTWWWIPRLLYASPPGLKHCIALNCA